MKLKNMTIAGNKALARTTRRTRRGRKAMQESTQKYNKERDKQQRTKREEANWPKKATRRRAKLANELHKEWSTCTKKAPAKLLIPRTVADDAAVRHSVLLEHALRGGSRGRAHQARSAASYIEKKGKKKWHMHAGQHKTVKRTVPSNWTWTQKCGTARQVLALRPRQNKARFLLSTKRYGNKLTRKDMMQMIRTCTKEYPSKNIGIQNDSRPQDHRPFQKH